MFYYQDETKTNRRSTQSSFYLSRMIKRNLKNCNTSLQLSSNCTICSDSHSNESFLLLYGRVLYASFMVHKDKYLGSPLTHLCQLWCSWASWGWPNELCCCQQPAQEAPHVIPTTQAHTGRGEKVTGKMWEGTGWDLLILRNREGWMPFRSVWCYFNITFPPSSNQLHMCFYTCLVPVETKTTKEWVLFCMLLRMDFWFSKSVGFNPINCLREGREQINRTWVQSIFQEVWLFFLSQFYCFKIRTAPSPNWKISRHLHCS